MASAKDCFKKCAGDYLPPVCMVRLMARRSSAFKRLEQPAGSRYRYGQQQRQRAATNGKSNPCVSGDAAMNDIPRRITLEEWDLRYEQLKKAGIYQPAYGGPLSRDGE